MGGLRSASVVKPMRSIFRLRFSSAGAMRTLEPDVKALESVKVQLATFAWLLSTTSIAPPTACSMAAGGVRGGMGL